MCNAVSLLVLKYDRKELVLHAYYWLKAKEITNDQPPMVLDNASDRFWKKQEFFFLAKQRSKEKPMQSQITFTAQLKYFLIVNITDNFMQKCLLSWTPQKRSA